MLDKEKAAGGNIAVWLREEQDRSSMQGLCGQPNDAKADRDRLVDCKNSPKLGKEVAEIKNQ